MMPGCSTKRWFSGLLGIVLLIGCQLPKDKQTAQHEIEKTLQEGINDNPALNKHSSVRLPEGVKEVLLSSAQESQSKNLPALEKRFNLFAEQVPARTFFLGLVEGTPYNITVHPNVEGKISLQLKKVTIPEVLETVRNVYGYDFRQTAQGVEVLPASLQTRAFPVNYLDIKRDGESETQVSAGTLKSGSTSTGGGGQTATDSGSGNGDQNNQVNSKITTTSKADFWEELKIAVETIIGNGEGRKVAVSPLASLIVVQGMPDELRRVEEFLKSAEYSLNRQVILEAKILEVELNDSFQAGINWALLSGGISAMQYGGSVVKNAPIEGDNFPILASSQNGNVNITPGDATNNLTTNIGTFGGVFALATNYKNLGTFIELLGAQGKVQVLSSPRVATTNNQKALIKVGSDQFFITNVSTTTTASAATSTTTPTVTFDSFFSGIALDVTPHINGDSEITLHIHPTISSVEDDVKNFTLNGLSQSYPLAKSIVRESDSMVRAKNGEMVIIGGLMQNKTSELKEGIPVLKDLPLLGQVFRHTVQAVKKSELVILLRPVVVNNNTWTERLNNTLDRFRKINEEIIRDENREHCKGANC